MRTVHPIAALLAALALGGPAAAMPSDLSADPRDRASLIALSSVYRVTVTIRVDALRLSDGTLRPLLPRARRITETGTAVAVGRGGWLVTAAHVASPDPATLAQLAYQNDLAFRGAKAHGDDDAARAWVAANRARIVGPGVVRRQVSLATPIAEIGSAIPVIGVRPSETADLALMRIDAPTAPALGLEEGRSTGTPIVTIGFGTGSTLEAPARPPGEPALRRGEITRSARLIGERPPRSALLISASVQRGDSGGPVIDARGDVRGIVTRRSPAGGIAEEATEVRLLLEEAGVPQGPDPTAVGFRAAMESFWALDLRAARDGFEATLRRFPNHSLAAVERSRAIVLADADYRLSGRRRDGFLLALGFLSALAAAACAVGLLVPSLRRERRAGTGG